VYSDALVNGAYIVASVLFILGLKGLAHPRTAVRGNLLGAAGMALAVGVALIARASYWYIGVGVAIGTAAGAVLALKIRMTAMPQLVALFNGFGGGASVLVAGADLMQNTHTSLDVYVAVAASGIIGAVTFWGSLVAYAKLQEYSWMKRPFPVPAQQAVNAALAILTLLLAAALVYWQLGWIYLPLVLAASVLGLLLVNPIGGADMPVVIALLNSYSGLAAAATGFVINNNVLIIAGSLVGASGVILTRLMCKAMNRSLFNVLFGVMGTAGSSTDTDKLYANVKSTTPEEVALLLDGARRVVIVPGYGMAVAQAQHAVSDLGNLLESRDIKVEYAIHPVAGRMPGHMNVLLAEADVEYDKLREMDEINPTMETADVAIVIGANDVVNPLARTDPQCPIAGMPIINVDKAHTVVVIKRSLSPGFAGIPNPLFAADNTLMLYGDGQDAVRKIMAAVMEG